MQTRILTYFITVLSVLDLSSSSFVHQCTFSEQGICGFKQSRKDLIDWTKQTRLSQLVLPAGNTLPTRQSGTHFCACYREEQPRERLISVNAILESPTYTISTSSSRVRLVMFYYFKLRDKSALYIKKMESRNGRPVTGTLIWSGNGLNFGIGWKKLDVEFNVQSTFKIVIEAVVSAIEYNSIRIDEYNLIIQNGGHMHPTQPGGPHAGPPNHPRIPARPPPAPHPKPKPRPTVKPVAPKPPPTIAPPRRTNPPAPGPPRRNPADPLPPRHVTVRPESPRGRPGVFRPTNWGPGMIDPTYDPSQDTDVQSTQLTTMVQYDSLPTFTQSLPLVAVSIGLGLFLVFLVVAVAWVIRCISRVNTPEYLQKKAMILKQSDSIRLANSKETSKETQRDSMSSNRSKRSGVSTCISPATPDECTPIPTPTPSSPSPSTSSECSAFPGFTPTPSEMQYQWVPMHRYEDIIDGGTNKRRLRPKVAAGEELYQNAPLNNQTAKEAPNPLRTIAEELEAQFRKQGVTLFKKHQNENVKNHEYVNKNAASNQNTYVCRSETDWVENSIYETGSVVNNTKNYEMFYRMPTL